MQIIILLIILRESLPQRKRLMFCDYMEEEIAEPERSVDEKEESGKQKEEECSHPFLPSNESNSLNPTLYECYDPMDSFEISLFDEVDAFYTFGHDVTMDDAYEDELAIVPHVKDKIVAIAPTLNCPIILLKSPTHIPENFALIKLNVMGCIYLMILKTVLKNIHVCL